MPSFFKNIKKLFSKPDHAKANNQRPTTPAVDNSKAYKKTPTKKPVNKDAPKISNNPYLDQARAKSINATVIDEATHQINVRDIDNNAIKIVRDLHSANYETYLVGGCVRDLLLSKRPKDFDVTTGAHPEQAHKVFSRSRLIGRRFKLLHVRFGRDLIEVATFRASHENNTEDNQAKQADSGMILRDNVYGTIDQDAMRRDFTINALYYDVKSHSIYDFTNGYEDINARQIRMIGDPSSRYREDPVRMLRAVRFAAKLDFEIEKNTAKPIAELAPLLFDIAPARLFDEVLKLLQSGHGNESLVLLREYKLLETILPQTAIALEEDLENANTLIFNALKNTDRRIKQRKSVSPGFLYATLLWPSVHAQLNKVLANKRIPPLSALHEVASKVILEQIKRTSIPKRFSTNIREIWELQFRLTRRPANKAEQLVDHPRFRAAYDLLLLREKSGEDLDNMSAWWTDYQSANTQEREELVLQLNSKPPKAKKKKAPIKKTSEKAVFEKFDVVEQVKAQHKPRPKKEPIAPIVDPVQSDNQTNIKEHSVETVAQANTASADPIIKKPSIAVQQPVEKAAPITQNIEPKVTEPKVIETKVSEPKVIKPEVQGVPVVTTQSTVKAPVADTLETAPVEKLDKVDDSSAAQTATNESSTNNATRKPRRSRAKNDPRNKA